MASDRSRLTDFQRAFKGGRLPTEPSWAGAGKAPTREQLIEDAKFRHELLEAAEKCQPAWNDEQTLDLAVIEHAIRAAKLGASTLTHVTHRGLLDIADQYLALLDAQSEARSDLRLRAQMLLNEARTALLQKAARGLEPDAPMLDSLGLSVRVYNRLRREGWQTIGDVLLADNPPRPSWLDIVAGGVGAREVRQKLTQAGWRQ
jgi:hypothetical protein